MDKKDSVKMFFVNLSLQDKKNFLSGNTSDAENTPKGYNKNSVEDDAQKNQKDKTKKS